MEHASFYSEQTLHVTLNLHWSEPKVLGKDRNFLLLRLFYSQACI